MSIELELQIASNAKTLPHPSQFREWISVALLDEVEETELTIRIVDKEEMTELNEQYRNKKGPTNVLSFIGSMEHEGTKINDDYLGDIVICAPIIEKEAAENDKELLAHWAHIVIHGALHLLGHDHNKDKEAKTMQQLETKLLAKLGYPPPYGDDAANEQR